MRAAATLSPLLPLLSLIARNSAASRRRRTVGLPGMAIAASLPRPAPLSATRSAAAASRVICSSHTCLRVSLHLAMTSCATWRPCSLSARRARALGKSDSGAIFDDQHARPWPRRPQPRPRRRRPGLPGAGRHAGNRACAPGPAGRRPEASYRTAGQNGWARLPAITRMRCRSRMKENAGHGGRALRLHVDAAHVRSRRRRCRAGQTRSGQAQGQDNGNDNNSPDAHDSSIAIPDFGHHGPETQPSATARLPSRGGIPVRALFMRLFLLLPDTEIC